jgi:hypothetical protein
MIDELVDRLAKAISPLVRCADIDFPHDLEWDGGDEAECLTEAERDERRAIVHALFAEMLAALAEMDAAGYALFQVEP